MDVILRICKELKRDMGGIMELLSGEETKMETES